MDFAETIYKIMAQKHMNQSAVARAAGFHPKTFNAMLRGRKVVRQEFILPICQALGVSPKELFGYEE